MKSVEYHRTRAIVEIAVASTAMMRVFKKGSVSDIENMIGAILPTLRDVHDQQQFDALHEKFCQRFMPAICLAKAKNGQSAQASYGHAAKVLDVALKVCVDFCQLPDASTSQRIKRFLHAGIDTQLLAELKEKECHEIEATSVQEIDRETYQVLQLAVARQIEKTEEFHGLLPVEYDNIKFQKLNPR